FTNSRWDILNRLKSELETAYQDVPQSTNRGRVNKGAVGTLLVKIYLSIGEFQKAVDIGKQVVSAHPLMTKRFTPNQSKANTNLMHDLHSVAAKIDLSNTEGILYVMSYPNVLGS